MVNLNFKLMKKSLLLLLALLLSAPSLLMAQDCIAPENVKAKIVLNDPDYGKKYKIIVTWDVVEGAELYAVYAASKNVPDGIWVGDAYTNEFIQGIDLDGILWFSVKTVCDATNVITSEKSEEVEVVLSEDSDDIYDPNAITAPENLTATAKSGTSIELTWDAVENASSYFVYRDNEEIANILETTYLDENLTADTQYCYTVSAMGITEESEQSEQACAKTGGESISEYESNFEIFPNPAKDEIRIFSNERIEEVRIYNINGQQTTDNGQQTSSTDMTINIKHLNSGVYFVKVKTNNSEVVRRFIKQ